MRQLILVFAATAILSIGTSAQAAPTCLDKDGDTIRCGVDGAMPVGWALPPDQQAARDMLQPDTDLDELWRPLGLVGAILALIGLMPPFDGRHDDDWDVQEGDDKRD